MLQSLTINMLPSNTSASREEMEVITEIVNDVFEKSEEGIWLEGTVRTNTAEISSLTESGEIAVARLNNEIVGCIRMQEVDQETGGFGMLAVASAVQGKGIASKLVHFAEQQFKSKSYRKIQLELLIPQEVAHPAKVFLEKWYDRIGYEKTTAISFEEAYPQLAPRLALTCKFVLFQKKLN